METNLQTFTNEQFGDVRTILEGDQILFVAADACRALGIKDPSMALRNFDDDEKGTSTIGTLGGKQKMLVVTEAGLYRLVFMSRKPNAKEFQRWIFHEVIPAIRKTGGYQLSATINAVITPNFLRQIANELEAKDARIAQLEDQNNKLATKAKYCDIVIQAGETVTATQIAKDYGMHAKSFNKLLEHLGVQFNQGGIWYLCQNYAKLGWASSKTVLFEHADGTPGAKTYTVWTQRGRLGLYELLKHKGYLPLIEQLDGDDDIEYEEV